MGQSKLLASIIAGAAVGAALSMLDRTTREKTIASTKRISETVAYYAANRDELQELIQEKVTAAQTIYESASANISMLADKADEFKELPSTIQDMISDTKSAFSSTDKE